MARGAVSCRKAFTRYYKCRSIWSEIEEELCKDIEAEKCFSGEEMIRESNCDKYTGKNNEAHNLNRLTANCVDGCNCDPVSRNGACTGYDQITDCLVMENPIDIIAPGISNLLENDGVVKPES